MGKKLDYVQRVIYGRHLNGGRKFLNSPVDNQQDAIERFYVRRITEMCMARFKWHGLPVSVDEVFLEQVLFQNALAVFYMDKRYGNYMAIRANQAGPLNVTENPTRFRVYGTNFIGGTIKAANCVPIWGSLSRAPELDLVYIYAKKLATIDRTIEINAHNARRTRVITATKNEELTATNMIAAMDKGDPTVYVSERVGDIQFSDKIEAIDLGMDVSHISELHILKVRLWNELMGFLGIDGANQDKKERLVADEVGANEEQINLNKSVALKTRRIAARQINAKFGLEVSVDYDLEDAGASSPVSTIGGL